MQEDEHKGSRRGRPLQPKESLRVRKLQVCSTESEYENVRELARRAGMPMGALYRALVREFGEQLVRRSEVDRARPGSRATT